ncbi:MAG: hypothetical protein RKP46_15290 [Candidatus Accumulibacter sp.]|uniref:hypothetical protein n=1 Tax=Accumulibacter sp. TaxID=2053492 RepID=UPI00287962E5|nr:hypothetical protein [Accumulibacter sp.]MDS4015691.1 hypothetical protein [Accumulibacter sp.]
MNLARNFIVSLADRFAAAIAQVHTHSDRGKLIEDRRFPATSASGPSFRFMTLANEQDFPAPAAVAALAER